MDLRETRLRDMMEWYNSSKLAHLSRKLIHGFRALVHQYEKPVMVLAASAGLSAVLLNLEFSRFEANLYDLRITASVASPADPEIVTITLDDASVKSLDQLSPFSLDYHTRLMEALTRYRPKAVGYLIDLNQVSQANPELFQSVWASRFVDAAHRMEAEGTAVVLGTPYDVTGEVVPPYPLSSLPHALALIHKDGNVFSEDKVTRRALVALEDKPSFHLELARRTGLIRPDRIPRGTFGVPDTDSRFFFFRYHGSTVLSAGNRRQLPYKRYSFSEVLRGDLPLEAFRGKIVLVGTLQKESTNDFAYTPYSGAALVNPKIAIHATILDSVIHDDGLVRPRPWVNVVITFSAIAFVLWFVLTLTPLYGVFATIALSLAFMLMCQLLFRWEGTWIRESQPLVGIFVGYYLAVPFRLIREYKKRWEYQRKNEILTQVEELKTNFLNLVTHDLKTPVARIQGLAEVLIRNRSSGPGAGLQALQHIIASTEELNRFITSILELSKVESQRLYLKVESRDINQLIERCVEGFAAQAGAREISIHTALEPLFPIRIDASLISKVINNLIDNALKYSPRGSEVFIESREIDHCVEISVRDEGIGMGPEEREHLFSRFYRAKNDRTAEIAGTGLGLYLTRYFIEAHGGRVEVESEKGCGSRFMIRLPVEGAPVGAVAEPSFRMERVGGLTRRLTAMVKNLKVEKA